MEIFLEIIYNFGILASLSIISGFIGDSGNKSWNKNATQGVLFGIASIIGMLHPLVLSPGLIFDGRSVMISLSGIFFGPIAAAIAGIMALTLRVFQGGPGALMGVLVIISSALIGVGFYTVRKEKDQAIPMKTLLVMGLIVHIVMVLMMFTLPNERVITTIKRLGLPVILVYPLATVLIGRILSEVGERRRISEALYTSQVNLKEANSELQTYTEELLANEEELQSQLAQIFESEERFRTIFENSADAIVIIKEDKIIDCNQAASELIGTGTKQGIFGKGVWELSPERQTDGQLSNEKALALMDECMKSSKIRFEWTHLRGDGSPIPVEVVLSSIILNGEKVLHGLIRDISERKAMEAKLENMSYHDQLTGIYNRRFFEEELDRLNVRRNLPLTIIIADVNGLKLVNDSFGHAVGDQLLKKVADFIIMGCRGDDIISRIGGDEFVILLTRTDASEAENIVRRIQELAAAEKVESIDISVSFGWATKVLDAEDVSETLKKAENHLYKKKLFESPSMRGKTIQTIIHTLHEKNKREEEHSRRVSLLCEKMGITMGLPETDVKELKNLGLLHDIGKIAIDEQMLNKPGKLTEEEWNAMARHPEIGYRILSTVNDMSEMAEYVLAHHERWDGKGYPKGLKDEEIPLQARIITLADAFDAMTSERSYKQAMSQEAAIEEIKAHSGKQFDPQLVTVFISMMSEE